jgi:hypothetical protein
MEAVRTSETSVDNYITLQYVPEDNSVLRSLQNMNKTLSCKLRGESRIRVIVMKVRSHWGHVCDFTEHLFETLCSGQIYDFCFIQVAGGAFIFRNNTVFDTASDLKHVLKFQNTKCFRSTSNKV